MTKVFKEICPYVVCFFAFKFVLEVKFVRMLFAFEFVLVVIYFQGDTHDFLK